MATTGFWPVKSRLKQVIDYADNPDKTTDRRYLDADLAAALNYVGNDDKTDQRLFVSAINCPPQRAYECMMATKQRYGKLGGNVAYHGYQSFVAGEVTPEEAHAIGTETARRMWGDDYEIVVTTHLNTDNIHNHILVNSVSFRTGRKFENHISDHIKLREISDEICREHGKKVLEGSHFYGNKKEYWVRKSGNLTHQDMLRRDLDEALSLSSSHKSFEYYLKCLGYRFERGFYYDHPSIIADGWQQSVRIDKLGERFSKENIRERLIENQYDPALYAPAYPDRKRKPLLQLEIRMRQPEPKDTLQLLFELFIELLKLCTGNNIQKTNNRPLSPAMRAEVRKLDQYLEDYKLLCDNKIETAEQLISFRNDLTAKITELEAERSAIRHKLRRVKTPENDAALKEQAKEITKQITPLRKQRQSSMRILERSIPTIAEALEKERQIETKNNRIIQKERGYSR